MRARRRAMAQGLRRCGLRVIALAVAALLMLAGGEMTAAGQEKPDPQSEIGGLHSKFVDVNGVKARYYEAGAGELMVMIHGGFTAGVSTGEVFSRTIVGVAKRMHVFAGVTVSSGRRANPRWG